MDLVKKTTSYQVENREWLGSQHGVEMAKSANLKLSLFTSILVNGYIPSGVILAKLDADELGVATYGPYDPASNVPAGVGTASGVLFNSMAVPAGVTHVSAPLMQHGKVRESKLPRQTGLGSWDAAASADLPHILFDVSP